MPKAKILRVTPTERAEAKIWAQSYQCPHCPALAKVGYRYVSVVHSKRCPRYHNRETGYYPESMWRDGTEAVS